MTALSANRQVDNYVDQGIRSYPVAASKYVYKGGFLGLDSSGYAQPLVAGNRFIGLAYDGADNSSGSNGDKTARVFTMGDFSLVLSGIAQTDIGRAVFASDDATLTFDPDGNSFVGWVQDYEASGRAILRLDLRAPAAIAPISHHAADFTLTPAHSGSTHTNLGASGTVVATLPQSPPTGTTYRFVCMADQALRLEPGAAGGIYVKGAKQVDDKYVSITDIGDFIHLTADGSGDWIAVASISGADADITVEG